MDLPSTKLRMPRAEQAATTLSYYQSMLVHALRQTPEYARALLALPGGPADHGASTDEIDRMIAARMRRASILYEPGRDITVLVGEAALGNQVGSAEVMERQRAHIAHLASSVTHAKVGVIPFDKCPILPLHGWKQRDNIVSIETTAGDREIADPAEVGQYRRWGDLLRDAATLSWVLWATSARAALSEVGGTVVSRDRDKARGLV